MAKQKITPLSIDLSENALWKQRFRANNLDSVTFAKANPQKGLVCCQADGVLQLHAWDVATGTLTQLTHDPVGVWRGAIAAQGDYVYYLIDEQGNEFGHHHRVPFTGGTAEDITPELPVYGSFSLSEDPSGQTIGFVIATTAGFQGYLIDRRDVLNLGQPRLIWQSQSRSTGPVLSPGSEWAVFTTTARSGNNAYSLEAVDVSTDKVIQELWFPQASIFPVRFAPTASSDRLLANTDVSGFDRPLIWNITDGSYQMIDLPDLEGNISAKDWSPQNTLLLIQYLKAKQQLYTYDLTTQTLTAIEHPSGTLTQCRFLDAEQVAVNLSSPAHSSAVLTFDLKGLSSPTAMLNVATAPPCQPWQSISFVSADSTEIQAWLAVPSGTGPFPTILHVHGGPTWAVTETYSPWAQAWLDQGFAWLSVNYRGSTTFGKTFEQAIWGQLGQLEVDDMVAARRWAVKQGIANPAAIFVTGSSYGGYLTLQALGKTPDLWAGGMAEVAIADWFLMYEDQSPLMQAAQRSFFGGTPAEKPEAHRIGSPITYGEQVQAPILVIQGRNDTRCPARQMEAYEGKLNAWGKSIQVHWFDAGHVAGDTEQAIAHQALKMQFAQSVLSLANRM